MEMARNEGVASRTILVIEDDAELSALLADYLGHEGFVVRHAPDGEVGLEQALTGSYCLVLLDIMLPGRDGIEVLRELRRSSPVPVIMLTAKGDDVDRIVGLELGADDYLPKPFNPRELVARIKAVLRRAGAAPAEDVAEAPRQLERGELLIDLEGYRASLQGKELPLTVIEFALLRELAQSPGRALSRETLLDRVRGRDFDLFDRSIDVHVSHLRQKLGDDPQHPRFIRTVRSIGYMFIGEGA
ncbi:MAG TPA: response regulator transcription factor [bacterium]|nr:response regulator transcription factor [bacterium]